MTNFLCRCWPLQDVKKRKNTSLYFLLVGAIRSIHEQGSWLYLLAAAKLLGTERLGTEQTKSPNPKYYGDWQTMK